MHQTNAGFTVCTDVYSVMSGQNNDDQLFKNLVAQTCIAWTH